MTTSVPDHAGSDRVDSVAARSVVAELAEIIERLALEPHGIRLGELTALVLRCRTDLAGSPAAALPELTERLARERIQTAAVDPASSPYQAAMPRVAGESAPKGTTGGDPR
ncbi:MAG: hypothetical protein ACRDQA_20920 [Nocardioidaceae bacterium]